jgi:sugar lactone lactonase YvrE
MIRVVLLCVIYIVHSFENDESSNAMKPFGLSFRNIYRSPSNDTEKDHFVDLKISSKISHPSISLEAVMSPNLFLQNIAGTGPAGYSGDNAPATSVKVAAVMTWMDTNGNIYVADGANYRIRKINPAGIIATFGGTGTQSNVGVGGPIGLVSFYYPYSIVGDTAGSALYIADQYYVWKYVFSTDIIAVFAHSTSLGRGYGGDNGPATSAQLNDPEGLWLTTSGVLYIADHENNRIRKVVLGIISTAAGSGGAGSFSGDGGPATSAFLKYPRGVYMDTHGKLFIADCENNRIRLVDTNNIITTFAGSGTASPFNGDNLPALTTNLNVPFDVKGDTAGNIYVADYQNCVVRMIDGNGIITVVFGTSGSCGFTSGVAPRSSLIYGPYGLWVDSSSTLYISDYNSIHRGVMVSSPTSQPTQQPSRQPTSQPSQQPTSRPSSPLVSPNLFMQLVGGSASGNYGGDNGPATSAQIKATQLWVDPGGNVYLTDYGNSRIRKVSPAGIITTIGGTGTPSASGASGPFTSTNIYSPFSIVGDTAGTVLYFTDLKYIWKYTFSSGIVSVYAGSTSSGQGFSGDGSPATSAQVYNTRGLWLTTTGSLFVADENNHRIRMIFPSSPNIIATVAGSGCGNGCSGSFSGDNGQATSASLQNPDGVYMDTAGKLFIADTGNNRIRMVNNAGIITTVAGSGQDSPVYSGNLPATSANIKGPLDVKGDSLGNIYITDSNHCAILKMDSTGLLTALFGSLDGTCGFSAGVASRNSQLMVVHGLWLDSQGTVYFTDWNSVHKSVVVSSPSSQPSEQPTRQPSSQPTSQPIARPSSQPSGQPTTQPTNQPTRIPSCQPTCIPSVQPTRKPSSQPSSRPSSPTVAPFSTNSPTPLVANPYLFKKLLAGSSTAGFSGDNGPATSAQIKSIMPWVDSMGNIYIPDDTNRRIRKVSASNGFISTFGGTGTSSTSGTGGPILQVDFFDPWCIVGDTAGTALYISDQQFVWKYSFSTNIVSVYAGTSVTGFSGDGSAATSAQLYFPMGLWLTTAGVLYVSDDGNHRIRKVVPGSPNIISTVAGSGCTNNCAGSYSGDGGPALSATLNFPYGIYMDTIGRLFIADQGNHRIRLMDTSGIITTFAGSGTVIPFNGNGIRATSANIKNPTDVKGDSAGNIYIINSGHFIVQVVDPNLIISTLFGYPGNDGFSVGTSALPLPINSAYGLWVDSSANVYVSDYNSIHRSVYLAPTSQPSGQPSRQPSAQPTTVPSRQPSTQPSRQPTAQPSCQPVLFPTSQPSVQPSRQPSSRPSSQPLSVPSSRPSAKPSGQPSRQPSTQPSSQPTSVPSIHLPPLLSVNGFVKHLGGTGSPGFSGDNGPATSAELRPFTIYADTNGNVFIADRGNLKFRKINSAGIVSHLGGTGSSVITGVGGTIGSVGFYSPFSIAGNAGSDYIYLSDQWFIWKYTLSTNIVTVFAGTVTKGYSGDNGPANQAQMQYPGGIWVTTDDILYIADHDNNRIRKIASNIMTSVAGSTTYGFSGDGGPASAATLKNPWSVYVDSTGRLFISDNESHRIRMVNTNNIITTYAGGGSSTDENVPATSAALSDPRDVKGDKLGNIYIADFNHCKIRIVSTSKIIATLIGNGVCSITPGIVSPFSSIENPAGIWLDSMSNVYFNGLTSVHRTIAVDSPTSQPSSQPTGQPLSRPSAQPTARPSSQPSKQPISSPSVVPSQQPISFPSGEPTVQPTRKPSSKPSEQPTIQPTNQPSSVPTRQPSSHPSGQPTGQPVSRPSSQPSSQPTSRPTSQPSRQPTSCPSPAGISSNLFMQLVTGAATQGNSGDGGLATLAQISPGTPFVDYTGNIYIPDENSFRIRKINTVGIIAAFGGTGNQATTNSNPGSIDSVSFYGPCSIVGDTAGNSLYISDYRYVWKYVFSSNIVTVFAHSRSLDFGFSGDNGPATSAQLHVTKGIWLTSGDVLYICDYYNNRIRKVSSGIITTVAGSGCFGSSCTPNFSGDNGPAAAATLSHPRGVYMDTNGKLFIADYENNRIRLVDTNNIITTFAGTGFTSFNGDNIPAASANIFLTGEAKGDSLGNIYFTEYYNCIVRMVNVNGIISTLFGTLDSCGYSAGISVRSSSIKYPLGLWVDSSSTVYVNEFSAIHRSIIVSSPSSQPSGRPSVQPTGQPSKQPISSPSVVPSLQPISVPSGQPTTQPTSQPSSQPSEQPTIQPTNQPSVQPTGQPLLRPTARPSRQPSSPPTEQPSGVPSKQPSSQPVSLPTSQPTTRPSSQPTRTPTSMPSMSFSNVFMQLLVGKNSTGFAGDGGPATSAKIYSGFPWVDFTGNIYIPEVSGVRIRKVSPTGIITGFGGPSISSSFYSLACIVGDSAGNFLYISDLKYVWKYSFANNIVSVYAGSSSVDFSGDNGAASSAGLNGPNGLWLTTDNVLFITDFSNHRIRKVVSSGIISSVAGSGPGGNPSAGFSGDNGPALSAMLRNPVGVYVNTIGRLFIADANNHRVRLVDTNNIITTFAGTGTTSPFNGENIPATLANINLPHDVKGDTLGNIYVADYNNCAVRVINGATGIISTVLGAPGTCGFTPGITSSRTSPINTPLALWVDSLSRVYFSDYNSIHRSITVSSPTSQPSGRPTRQPSRQPSSLPSSRPTTQPTGQPSEKPSSQPTRQPSRIPTLQPTVQPSSRPSNRPSTRPSQQPSCQPSTQPVSRPTRVPSSQPTAQPSRQPTVSPSLSLPFISPNLFMQLVAGGSAEGDSGDNGPATSAQIRVVIPWVDTNGNVYVPDDDNLRFRRINTAGIITTFGGTTTSSTAIASGAITSVSFYRPTAVVGDLTGAILYLTDRKYVWKYSFANNIVSVYAGVASSGFSGDNGPATSAAINYPTGLWLTTDNNLFFADYSNHRVRKISPSGIISSVAGTSGPAGYSGDNILALSATLNNPTTVYVDTKGRLFIADYASHRIRLVDTNNIITTFAGSGNPSPFNGEYIAATLANLDSYGVTGDSMGNIYLSDIDKCIIRIVTGGSGIISTLFGSPTSCGFTSGISSRSSLINHPNGIWIDSLSQIYFGDYRSIHRSITVSSPTSQPSGRPTRQPSRQPSSLPSSRPTTQPSGQPSQKPSGQPRATPTAQPSCQPSGKPTDRPQAVAPSNLFMKLIAGKGTTGHTGDGGPATSAEVSGFLPFVDTVGNIYLPGDSDFRIRKINTAGIITTFGGTTTTSIAGTGGPIGTVSFSEPYSVVGDTGGSFLYISDKFYVWKYSFSSNIISVYCGLVTPGDTGDGGPVSLAQIRGPRGLWLTTAGVLFIADAENNRIRKVLSGIITTVAGSGGPGGFTGDGGQATSALLNDPRSVYMDSNGKLFIGDRINNRIRVIATNGIISTCVGTGDSVFNGDHLPATSANIGSPWDVKGDSLGNIYIADSANFLVRMMDGNSEILSILFGKPGISGFSAGISLRFSSINTAYGLWVDSLGTIFFSDYNSIHGGTLVASPTSQPSEQPTGQLAMQPTRRPASPPSSTPTCQPSTKPSARPIMNPTGQPSIQPTCKPSSQPTGRPTCQPSRQPTRQPTVQPTESPTSQPSRRPTQGPTAQPTTRPSSQPSVQPSRWPSGQPSLQPSGQPSSQPTTVPSGQPSNQPTARPSHQIISNPNLFMQLLGGTGIQGYSGDNGPATSANVDVYIPFVDNGGNIYLPSSGSNGVRIRKINPSGIITTFGGTGTSSTAGTGGAITSVSFGSPWSVVGDAAATFLFICDSKYVWKYLFSDNSVVVVAGTVNPGFSGDTGSSSLAQLKSPSGLWLTTGTVLYIADEENHRIRKIESGIISTVAGSAGPGSFAGDGGQATAARLNGPYGVYMDTTGKLFIADNVNYRIRVVDTNNIITTFAGSGVETPFNGENIPATSANLNHPHDVKGDFLGNIYIAEFLNCAVRVVDRNGIISTMFGSPGACGFSPGVSPRTSVIGGPIGLWLDSQSTIYFSGIHSIHRSVVVSSPTSQPSRQPSRQPTSQPTRIPTRQPTTKPTNQPSVQPTVQPVLRPSSCPSGQPSSVPSNQPSGQPSNRPTSQPFRQPIAVPSTRPSTQPTTNPTVHLSQSQVNIVSPNLHMQLMAGMSSAGFSGDNGPATSAQIQCYIPWVDSNGNIYIPDTGSRIRKVTSAGIITTFGGTGTSSTTGTGGPIGTVSFKIPYSIIGDTAGNALYISDQRYVWKYVFSTGIVSVYAGSGGVGFSGDNGPAVSAQLDESNGLWLTTSDVFYVADRRNNRIRKISATSIITTVVGSGATGGPGSFSGDGGLATAACLDGPSGVYMDTAGRLFIADPGNKRIRFVDTNNIITTFAGTGSSNSFTGENIPATTVNITPYDVKGDLLGNIYIADHGNNLVRRVDNSGIIATVFGSPGASGFSSGISTQSSLLAGSLGIWIDSLSTVYFSDYNTIHRGILLSRTDYPNLFMENLAGTGDNGYSGDNGPATAAQIQAYRFFVDSSGNIYFPSGTYNGPNGERIRKISPSGTITSFGGTGTGSPASIVGDASNTFLYICDQRYIWKYLFSDNSVAVFAGSVQGFNGETGPVGSIQLSDPQGLWLTTGNVLYIADHENHRIRKVVSNIITTVAGSGPGGSGSSGFSGDNGPATSARLYSPDGVYVNSNGIIFITDSNNFRIRVVDTNNIITTFAGTGNSLFNGDYIPATSANLYYPSDVKGDTLGNIYIADNAHYAVRVVNGATGIITTLFGNPGSIGGSVGISPRTASINNVYSLWIDSLSRVYFSDLSTIHRSITVSSPTSQPSGQPTRHPSQQPTVRPTCQPTEQPSNQPSSRPSGSPARQPTGQPYGNPTGQPSSLPTVQPTRLPTSQPTMIPTCHPSQQPTTHPTSQPSVQSTNRPTNQPTDQPSGQPYCKPTSLPSSQPSRYPSGRPSKWPSSVPTAQPTRQPSGQPSNHPSSRPTVQPSGQPSREPISRPTSQPTEQPSRSPTSQPFGVPTRQPSSLPSSRPSSQPSKRPIDRPTAQPTGKPSGKPSSQPTSQPFSVPSSRPTVLPSVVPSEKPSSRPTHSPTTQPTGQPSSQPSSVPSASPTNHPTDEPTLTPSGMPSSKPSQCPTNRPTTQPTREPSCQPSSFPSGRPTRDPSSCPSAPPSAQPFAFPTSQPSPVPSTLPTSVPSTQPSNQPTVHPSVLPSSCPSTQPSSDPSCHPTVPPTSYPSVQPTDNPTGKPSLCSSSQPSSQPTSIPSSVPVIVPSSKPSNQPTGTPSSSLPSVFPSSCPSTNSTFVWSTLPSSHPSSQKPGTIPSSQPSDQPTGQPLSRPSSQPSRVPTHKQPLLPIPANQTTTSPTGIPTERPSSNVLDSEPPTVVPSIWPTYRPSTQLTSTINPTTVPSSGPNVSPTTMNHSNTNQSLTSSEPSNQPTIIGTSVPSNQPIISSSNSSPPTVIPSRFPTELSTTTSNNSSLPTTPSVSPTKSPTLIPSRLPTELPIVNNSSRPISTPTLSPTMTPTVIPSSHRPSLQTTPSPASSSPSHKPTFIPSLLSSASPSHQPTVSPSLEPNKTHSPSFRLPTEVPTVSPTKTFSVISRESGSQYFKGTFFLLGRSFPSQSVTPSLTDIHLDDNDLPNHHNLIIFGRRENENCKDIVTGSRESHGLYSEVIEQETSLFLESESRSSTIIGDINSDGLNDLLIGYPRQSKCFIYFGHSKESFTNLGVSFAIYGTTLGDDFGWAAAGLGDYNQDGNEDFIVSAKGTGIVYLFFGKKPFDRNDLSIERMTKSDGFKIIGQENTVNTGLAVSNAGDFNQDGFTDILISALSFEGEGIIYLLFGNPHSSDDVDLNGFHASTGFIFKTPSFSFSGLSLTGLGDFNQDGFDDIAIGSLPYQGGYSAQVTYVVFGRNHSFLTSNNGHTLFLSEMNEREKTGFKIPGGGFLVSGVDDVNNDNIPDLMITNYPHWHTQQGNAYLIVYPGKNSVSSPPSYFPSSLPSSLPSQRPTARPSIPVNSPTNLPSIDFFSDDSPSWASNKPTIIINNTNHNNNDNNNTTNVPTFPPTPRKTFRPSLQMTSRPSTLRPSKSPSRSPTRITTSSALPTTAVPTFPTRTLVPTITTTSSSSHPSRLTRSISSFSPSSQSFSNSSSTPTTDTEDNDFISIHIQQEGHYNNATSIKNILFLIETSGNVLITGSKEGKNIYKFLPSLQKTEIRITNFKSSVDQLDFLAFPQFLSVNDLPFTTNPLIIYPANNYQIIFDSLNTLPPTTETNFLFTEPDSEQSSSSFNFSDYTTSIELITVLFPVVIMFVCFLYVWGGAVDNEKKEDKLESELSDNENDDDNNNEEPVTSPLVVVDIPVDENDIDKSDSFESLSSSHSSSASLPASGSASFLFSLSGASTLGSQWLSKDEDDVEQDLKAQNTMDKRRNALPDLELGLQLPDNHNDHGDGDVDDDLSSDNLQHMFDDESESIDRVI